ncbi:MAG: hypothetical protein WC634_03290 [archaeon]
MNSRGQAALEYLMTYGWALIVIAIVVGVLVFIVATPTNTLQCNSSQPGKLNVVSNNLKTCVSPAGASIGNIAITNLTGGQATLVDINGTGFFAADPVTGYTGTGTLVIGSTTLNVLASAVGSATSATMVIGYNDAVGLRQNATITCQGTTVTVQAAACP